MKNAFDANVPKRKPRTRLRGILDEIDSEPGREPEAAGHESARSRESEENEPRGAEATVSGHAAVGGHAAVPASAPPEDHAVTGACPASVTRLEPPPAPEPPATVPQPSEPIHTPAPKPASMASAHAAPAVAAEQREPNLREVPSEPRSEAAPPVRSEPEAVAPAFEGHAQVAKPALASPAAPTLEQLRAYAPRSVEAHERASSARAAGVPHLSPVPDRAPERFSEPRSEAGEAVSYSDGFAPDDVAPERFASQGPGQESVPMERFEPASPPAPGMPGREGREAERRESRLEESGFYRAPAAERWAPEAERQAPSAAPSRARAEFADEAHEAREATGSSGRFEVESEVPERSPSEAAVAGRPRAAAPGAEVVLAGRARIAELRARLQSSVQRRDVRSSAEPAATALRIRETMAALRTEVREMSEERSRLMESLELTRRELAEAEKALESERRMRQSSEQLAEERGQVAEHLLAESEALAEERDEALARIVELRELDSQQAELVEDMQRRLAEHEDALQKSLDEVSEVRAALEAAEGELGAVQARLDARSVENDRLRARIDELESEMRSSSSARDALSEIQKLVDSLA